ncbi:ArsR family transcriptional regulator [Desulfacinum hydrothermale DSM 13146]|uniref:ArsR family transcriptional regulator n=1 Tax=Desulfacinum hydrothermale DSM 13146 TaxID=1121390 RepID=A0A1W1XSQ7_9BACT|nr:metalloregulator ArsR/SmtB family transcription factor [Desulfacinum hydrothermale]SMC26927.1 ArsR family transcriptional regulator [Desulfacinum hydrothermale DSM 13146]
MATPDVRLEHLQKAAEVLRVVAHPVRLQILQFLEGGEKTVTEIHTGLDLPQAYTSQQLNLMKSKDILASRRDGSQVFYRIANWNVLKIIHCVCADSAGETAQT